MAIDIFNCLGFLNENHLRKIAFDFSETLLSKAPGILEVSVKRTSGGKGLLIDVTNYSLVSNGELRKDRSYLIRIMAIKIAFIEVWCSDGIYSSSDCCYELNNNKYRLQSILSNLLLKINEEYNGNVSKILKVPFLLNSNWKVLCMYDKARVFGGIEAIAID
jgi:hypothetical protein